MTDVWFCEECGQDQYSHPAHIETYPGDVELWFCENCVDEGEAP